MSGKNRISNKVKRRKKSKAIKTEKKKVEPILTANGASKSKKWVNGFNKYWKIIAGIFVISTFIINVYKVWPKTDKEKFDEDYTIKGKIESPASAENFQVKNLPNFNFDEKHDSLPKIRGIYIKDLEKYSEVYFHLDGNTYGITLGQLKEGVTFGGDHAEFANGCVNRNLTIAEKNNRIFVSSVFKDIESENEIGKMEFNHWTLYKGTFLDYHSDLNDRKFEVIDKKGNILFSIAFSLIKNIPTLKISGYFVDENNAMVVNDGSENSTWDNLCYSKNDSSWKQKVLIAIQKIKSVF